MRRVVPGILLAAGWFLLLFLGTAPLFWGVVLGMALVALREFFRMALPSLAGVRLHATMVGCLAPMAAAAGGQCEAVLCGVVASLLVIIALALHGYEVIEDLLKYLSVSSFATLYISLSMALVVLLRFEPQGPFWLALLIAIVAGSDTGAYYAGRAFGRRKLFPRISPNKTVAGGIGGLVAGVVTAEMVNLALHLPAHPVRLLFVSFGLIVIGIAGDLTESMIKRSAGVKDSGTILLGHGGLLDRIDSLLLTGPVLFLLHTYGLLR